MVLSPRRLALALCVFAATVLGSAGTASATHYRGWATCNALATADRDRVCFQGDLPGGVFRAKNRDDVRYRFCVGRPSGDRDCEWKRTRDAGEKSVVGFFAEDPGRYRLKWRVPGVGVVDRWRLRVKPEPG